MKTKIGRRAKSALAILLTLCMVFSVFTVGVVSVGAATADSESVGWSDLTTVLFDNSKTKWQNVYLYICETGYVRSYQMTATGNSSVYVKTDLGQWSSRQNMFFASVGNYNNGSSYTNAHTASLSTLADGGSYTARISASDSDANHIFYPANGTNGAALSKADAYVLASGASEGSAQLATASWSTTSDVMNYNGSSYSITYTDVADGSYAVAVVKYNDWNASYKYDAAGTGTNCTLSDNGGNDNNLKITTTAKSDITITLTSSNKINVTATLKKISAPTNVRINSATSSSVNADSSANSSLTWTAVSGAASYKILQDGTQVGTSSTTSYSISNTVANAGSYTVIAVPSDSGYLESDESDEATLTVYEPMYAISGNHVGWGAYLLDDDSDGVYDYDPYAEGDIIAPSGTASYFNTWQEALAINEPTTTPGVYRFTFKTKEKADYDWEGFNGIGLCLYQKDTAQRAFIKNGTAYNTSGNDLTITDVGIVDGDNLYVNNLDTPAGGSLVLKRGQTYTITIDQTQRYNNDSSYPYGKITITTSDVFADVAAKKQVFNPTTGAYEAVADAESTIGTATAVPLHSAGSLTTVLTAVDVNHNYDFMGWYSDAECTNRLIAPGDCTESDYTYTKQVTINATTEYYALFKQKTPNQYDVDLVQPSSGVVSTTGGVSGGKAYQGATVSVNATVTDTSKEFSHWVITNTASGVDITSTVCANPTLAATTFTMPAVNVTVTAMYKNRTVVNVNVTSSDTSLGTATYTDGKYYVGDTINISATNTGGVFVRWVVTGGTAANLNSASTTITATGASVTARAVFDYKTYNLYYDSKLHPMIRQSDGTYVSTMKLGNNVDFTVYNVSDSKYAVSAADGNSWYIKNTNAVNVSSWGDNYTKYYHTDSLGTNTYFVKFDPSGNSGTGTIQLIATNPMGTIAQVYAKDGTVRYASGTASSGDLWSDGGEVTAKKGTTTVTKINTTAVSNPDSTKYPSTTPTKTENLRIYSAPIGSTITIETQVGSTYTEQGFYVGMYVINGWKVPVTDMGSGKFTATYTLSDDYDVVDTSSNKSFEITPVYYNKNFQYVTFYVDAASVPDNWKGTISTCADYVSVDGTSATSSHYEGSYPGQPLGREGDLYEIKVAKYYYDNYNSTTGKWSEHTNYYPSATITAYNYDVVHHYYYVQANNNLDSADTNTNYQTYDYADFSYLAQIEDIEAIMFKCMKETENTNRDYCAVGQHRPADNEVNTYHLLTDYYGNPIDALGNKLTGDALTRAATATNNTADIKIVSCGNISNKGNVTDAQDVAYNNWRTKAQWITAWKVFENGGNQKWESHIAVGTPADFINTNANTSGASANYNFSYASGKSASDLTNKVTFISYEKELANDGSLSGDSGNTGVRIDGQWYYSAQHDFDSNVKVAITTSETSAVTSSDTTIEEDSNSANTGYIGTTSKTKATLDGETTHTYSNVTTEAELKCTPGSGYTFVGWYIYDGSTYTKIHDNFVDMNTTMTMKKNYTIVAVVREVGAGDMVITHTRYTGTSPSAHDGTGKYYVSAVVNKGKTGERTIAEAQNSITVPSLAATDTLTITIRTVCDGADTFYAWYEEALNADYSRTGKYYEICDENVDPLGQHEVSYTFFEADCSTFFEGSTLARKTIDLYSDIVHVSAYATLTYKYYDRFETSGEHQMVSYVVKNVPLSTAEIEAGYIPTDETISRYAPTVVDTIYTDTKWTVAGSKVERTASNILLIATQSPKNCYVQYLLNDGVSSNLFSGNTLLDVDEVAAWNTRIVPFNSWLIDENADMDNPEESDFYVSAPSSIEKGETTYNFVRFDLYSFDRLTGEIGDVIYSSNDNHFGYRIYADCVIYPVYTTGSVTPELTANIEPAVLNREVYGDSASPVDRLYADLIISYINIAAAVPGATIPDVIYENDPATSLYTIETGVILDKTLELSETDYNTLSHAAQAGTADDTESILAKYTGLVDISHVTALTNDNTAYTGLTKYQNDNSNLTNKNRLDKVFRYTNTTTAQKRVFAAYSYVVIRNTSNEVVASAISDPQKFNFAYVGNKPLETVS